MTTNSLAVLGVKILTGMSALSSVFLVQNPAYFTQEQMDRPLVMVSPSPAPVLGPFTDEIEEIVLPSPSPTPLPIAEQVSIPAILETPYGEITYDQVIRDMWGVSYDSSCLGCSDTTATGMKQGYGVVAVDPKIIPLYSRLYVPGYGIAVAGDVGGAVKGKVIDLGYDKLDGQWAAHYVDVYVLVP